ncbi:MAG: glycosyltransferase family 39 protein [Vicinamibacteria bacterium]|nr:glycosyltransferase family 39 protein [Vicinamibacteria bacterium]
MTARNRQAAGGCEPAHGIVIALVLVKLAIHLPLAARYGYFRDELYFLDCGRHLDWGYVDHAPLIGWISRLALLFGGSLPLLRGISALAGAGVVALAIVMAARLGGGRFAQFLTGLSVVVAPGCLGGNSLFSMNSFAPLFWTGGAYVFIRIVQTGDSRLWLLFGALAGLGLENKHSMAFFSIAFLVGLLFMPERRELARPWIWLGAAIALLLFMPNLIWQWQHGFPTIEDLRNVKAEGKNVVLSPGAIGPYRSKRLAILPSRYARHDIQADGCARIDEDG